MTDTKAETAATFHATALSLAGAEGEAGAEAAFCRCGARDPREQQERYKEFRTFLPHHGERGKALLRAFRCSIRGRRDREQHHAVEETALRSPETHSACPQHRAP